MVCVLIVHKCYHMSLFYRVSAMYLRKTGTCRSAHRSFYTEFHTNISIFIHLFFCAISLLIPISVNRHVSQIFIFLFVACFLSKLSSSQNYRVGLQLCSIKSVMVCRHHFLRHGQGSWPKLTMQLYYICFELIYSAITKITRDV